MLRLTENLMSLIITDWLTREVNKDDARGGVQKTGLTQSHALTPVKHVSSPQRKRTHQMATRSTQCPVAFSLHTALSPATVERSTCAASNGGLSLSLPHTSPLLSFSHFEATQLPRRSSQPEPTCCSFFIAVYFFSFPFVVDSLKHSRARARVCVCFFTWPAFGLRNPDLPPSPHSDNSRDQKRGYGQRQ